MKGTNQVNKPFPEKTSSAINPVLDTATTKAERTALGEFFVLSNHTQQRRSGSVFFNHLVFGWDDKQQKFTMWQFDSTGQSTDTPAIGSWENNILTLHRQTPQANIRYAYAFESERRYNLCIERSHDGSI